MTDRQCRCGGWRVIEVDDGRWVRVKDATSNDLERARRRPVWPGVGGIGWACDGPCPRDGVLRREEDELWPSFPAGAGAKV